MATKKPQTVNRTGKGDMMPLHRRGNAYAPEAYAEMSSTTRDQDGRTVEQSKTKRIKMARITDEEF